MRKLVKAAAALTAGCMLLSTSAFAAVSDNINETAQLTGGAYQVDLTYDIKSGQSTILVVKEGTALADVNDQNILYINQDAINTETGVVSYNVNLGATFTGNADVWVGGTNEGTATKIGTLSGVKAVTDLTLVADVTELEIGETATLTATVIPADATNKTVEWTGNVTDVAVDAENANIVTAKFTAPEVDEDTDFVITAKAGDVTKTVTIKVKAKVEVPAGDFITATDKDKATIVDDVASVTNATMGVAVGNKIVSLALNATAYPETGYIVTVVANDEVAEPISSAVVYYSAERAKYVALIPTTVTDYKFKIVPAGTEGATANVTLPSYGNLYDGDTRWNARDYRELKYIMASADNSMAKSDVIKAVIADVYPDGRVNARDARELKAKMADPNYVMPIVSK